jgi:4-diphosphocytidyl-2-C-methyl-D-erythritol kinase
LGGGSSDAAATILGLTRLLGLKWSIDQMAGIGAAVGQRRAVFFVGPAACVTGRGEQVRAVQVTGARWIVLVNPGFPVETKWAYQQLSATRAAVRPLSTELQQLGTRAVVDWSEIIPLVENDFEAPVFSQHPVLARLKSELLRQGAEVALLSGSGATMFGDISRAGRCGAGRRCVCPRPEDERPMPYRRQVFRSRAQFEARRP